jgi:O-methyltransferase
MDNLFITQYFDWQIKRRSVFDRVISRLFSKLGFNAQVGSATAFDAFVNRVMRGAGLTRPPEPMAAIYSGEMTTVEQRMNMFHLLSQVLVYGVPGDVVELGCNEGCSAVLFQKVVSAYDPSRKLHLYDSFRGLPPKTQWDGNRFQSGWLATTEQAVLENFRRYSLPEPQIHADWFEDTLPNHLPAQIAFAHLDGDFYESILTSLHHVHC